MKRASAFGGVLVGLAFLIFAYARWIEPDLIFVEEVTLEVPGLDPVFEALRVVVVADLHIESVGLREERLVKRVNELEPDVLFVLGDFVQNAYWMSDYLGYVAEACSLLRQMPAGLGAYGVFGNNDEPEVMVAPLAAAGVRVLENETVELGREGARLRLGGLGDPVTNRDDWERLLDGPRPDVLLAHSPDAVMRAEEESIPLVLAGHTHGGQVRHPFILLDPVRFLRLKPGTPAYRAGRYERGSTTLYVNRGIGCTHMRLRFLCPPEVTVVHLVPAL